MKLVINREKALPACNIRDMEVGQWYRRKLTSVWDLNAPEVIGYVETRTVFYSIVVEFFPNSKGPKVTKVYFPEAWDPLVQYSRIPTPEVHINIPTTFGT